MAMKKILNVAPQRSRTRFPIFRIPSQIITTEIRVRPKPSTDLLQYQPSDKDNRIYH